MDLSFIEPIVDVAIEVRVEFSSVCKFDLHSALLLFIDSFQVKYQMAVFEAYLKKAVIELCRFSVNLVLDGVLAAPRYSLHTELHWLFQEFVDLDPLYFVELSDWYTFF